MERNIFEQLIREAIATLPEQGRKAMDNVVFIVEGEMRHTKAKEVGITVNEVLLGLYEGIPKTQRGSGYFGVIPDKITLFQKPIEELGNGDMEEVKKHVREVIVHEVGHHLGFNEEEIRALEAKKKFT